jgi:hypothetical protein
MLATRSEALSISSFATRTSVTTAYTTRLSTKQPPNRRIGPRMMCWKSCASVCLRTIILPRMGGTQQLTPTPSDTLFVHFKPLGTHKILHCRRPSHLNAFTASSNDGTKIILSNWKSMRHHDGRLMEHVSTLDACLMLTSILRFCATHNPPHNAVNRLYSETPAYIPAADQHAKAVASYRTTCLISSYLHRISDMIFASPLRGMWTIMRSMLELLQLAHST